MTADRAALVEKMCIAVATAWDNEQRMQDGMSAALDLAIDRIRAEVLEEAAQTVETCEWWTMPQCDERASIAAAIRALKGENNDV